jgi:AbrB family looped-hinge helix DNA binding protein
MRVSSKNQITLPVDVMRKAGIKPGDDLIVRETGPGKVEIERVSDHAQRIIDEFAGTLPYPEGYLDELRDEWER